MQAQAAHGSKPGDHGRVSLLACMFQLLHCGKCHYECHLLRPCRTEGQQSNRSLPPGQSIEARCKRTVLRAARLEKRACCVAGRSSCAVYFAEQAGHAHIAWVMVEATCHVAAHLHVAEKLFLSLSFGSHRHTRLKRSGASTSWMAAPSSGDAIEPSACQGACIGSAQCIWAAYIRDGTRHRCGDCPSYKPILIKVCLSVSIKHHPTAVQIYISIGKMCVVNKHITAAWCSHVVTKPLC